MCWSILNFQELGFFLVLLPYVCLRKCCHGSSILEPSYCDPFLILIFSFDISFICIFSLSHFIGAVPFLQIWLRQLGIRELGFCDGEYLPRYVTFAFFAFNLISKSLFMESRRLFQLYLRQSYIGIVMRPCIITKDRSFTKEKHEDDGELASIVKNG